MSEDTREVTLDAESFENLINAFSILKDACNDIDIREGIVRQRSNDRTVIFELDLTSILSDISLPISNVKTKFDLFKMFQGNDVTLEIRDDDFIVKDNFSSLKFIKPSLEYIDNTFMSADEMNALFELNDEDQLLQIDIAATISERLKVISGNFNISSVQFFFMGEEAFLSAATQAKDQFAKLIENISLNKEVDKYVTNLPITPFVVEHDGNIDFTMYNDRDDQLISKSASTIGNCDITVFGRSALKEIEE